MVALACVARNVENRREPRNIHSTSFGHSRLWKSVERAEFVERTVMFSGRNSGKRNCLYTTIRAANARRHSNLPPPLLRKTKKAALFAKSSFLFTPSVAPCWLRSSQVAPSLTNQARVRPRRGSKSARICLATVPEYISGNPPSNAPFRHHSRLTRRQTAALQGAIATPQHNSSRNVRSQRSVDD